MACMADLRLWSRELVMELITMYKSFPCLWKVKSEEYKNKHMKSAAYKELAQFCKNRGFTEATRDFVVRKIQSLRGSFRKELRRTREYQKLGKTYHSNLWYYNNLLFTKDQETSEADDDTNQQSDDETCQSADDAYEDEDKFLVEEKPSTTIVNVPAYTADSPQSPPSSPLPKKHKRTTGDCVQPEFFDIGQDMSKFKDISEFELIGMNITKKLARMDPTQAIYAESIVNNVIRKGLLKKLKEETDLCDNMCGKRMSTVNNLPS